MSATQADKQYLRGECSGAIWSLAFIAWLVVSATRLYSAAATELPPPFLAPRVVHASASANNPSSLRIVTWNIDHGAHFDQVLNALRQSEADIVLLQEVDWGVTRSGGRDVTHDLGAGLGLSQAFGIEFEELSQERDGTAYTGQATLSRLPIRSARILRFKHQSGFWAPHSWMPSSVPLLQRRLGSRIALVTELELGPKLLVVYNTHLESRSYGRIQFAQLQEILTDCTEHYPPGTPILLGGDLNSKYLPSLYLRMLERAGFQNATGTHIERTHTIVMALDWLFTRNLPAWETGQVNKSAHGSDHYLVEGRVTLKK